MLFQNDSPIDVACHRHTLNMQVSFGTKNNSSPNKPSCTTVTVSFNGVLLEVPGALHIKVRRESDCKLNLDSSENIIQHHCCGVHNLYSRLIAGEVQAHLTGLRANRSMCPQRLP
ncbi:uncharacterized protein TNCV_543391 [Trichonephila clavipes]|nr:uncharacterized protein TNCV_543391 [Trichonephila clavipes]